MAKETMGLRIDGVTFEAIEGKGRCSDRTVTERIDRAHLRTASGAKAGNTQGRGKVRVLSIPAIRDRVVQGALSSYWSYFRGGLSTGLVGYRPKRQRMTR